MRTILTGMTMALCLGVAMNAIATVPSAAQAKDGAITVALSGGLDRLDPALTSNGTDLVILGQIYDTLLRMDPDGTLQPAVAKSYEATGENTWRFHLRDDVKFQDGSKLTAADVKFSIERILDKSMASTHASQLSTIENVVAVDDYTIDLVTRGPDPQLPRRMQAYGGTGRVFIVSKNYVESNTPETVSDKPMGSGPYKLDEWSKGQKIVLSENADYWGDHSDVKLATFTFIPENSTRVNALLQKEVDLIQRLPIADIERVEGSDSLHVIWTPNGLVHNINLDCRSAPFDDIEVRKAFSESLDLEGIVESLLGEYGRVLSGPLPPQVVQYDETLEPRKYDPEAAFAVVQEKGLAPFSTNTSDGRYIADREIYQAINAQAGAVGFQITPRVMEWGRLINMIINGTAGPLYIVGWDYSENDASKMHAFGNSSRPTALCKVPGYDEAANKAMTELDDEKRTALWREAQRAMNESYMIAGTWQAASIFGARNEIKWEANFGDNISLSDIKIEP
ncbi:ABC transporter substrate-binding protein [Mesorhizobium sp. CAU 1732]|uniref:ABC transporter substrate-binding protein n=1 Tax=Mesorhizobium sp. CAU 1732 TaxID=3140358 RepID=UPI00326174CC